MERLSLFVLTCLFGIFIASTSYAATIASKKPLALPCSGFYVGAILGASDTNYSKSAFDNPKNGKNVENGVADPDGFGYRVLAGYQFNRHFAAEAGFTHFDSTAGRGLNYVGGPTNQSGYVHQHAVDLMVKGIVPVSRAIALYAKLGAAYVFSYTKVRSQFSKHRNAVRPAGALGISFAVTRNFGVDASYNRIQSSGSIKSAELLGIGFYWHF